MKQISHTPPTLLWVTSNNPVKISIFGNSEITSVLLWSSIFGDIKVIVHITQERRIYGVRQREPCPAAPSL